MKRVWFMPVLLACVSLAGLLAALIGDGVFDAASWLFLGAPLAVLLWALTRRRSI